MNTVVFAPETLNLAETTRMIEIAKETREKFRCVFFGYSDIYSNLIEQAGFEFRRMTPWLTKEKIEHLWKVDRMESFEDPFSEGELMERVGSEIALYKELSPNAIVIGFTLSVTISARVSQIPLVYVLPFPLTRPFLEAGLATFPDEFDYPILRIIPHKLLDGITNQWLKTTKLWIKPFQQVAKHYGTPPIHRLVDIYEGDFNLVTDIPEISGVKDLPENWRYVGPIFAHLEGAIPSELLDLSHDQPLIYCSMGSSANREILRTVIESFDKTPYTVIAPVKAHITSMNIAVPKNVLVFDWLPADKVNPLADIAVVHGGQGTVQTACAAGTPFVGIGLQPEQESNIEAIVRQGCAIRVRKRRLSRTTLLAAIEQLLADPVARQKAQEIQKLFAAWNGTKNSAAFLINKFGQAA
jgi:UDP:flavonoid glycosyltransferase YjiC (YdhE family)